MMADLGNGVAWALTRLRELRGEYAGGEAALVRIERDRAHVQESMLRVAGAIQVLEELVAASGAFEATVDPTPARAAAG
jgi:hypothetical protein